MNTKYILYCSTVLMLLASGCASKKSLGSTTQTNSRFRRVPIHEVTEEQLHNDGVLIDAMALLQADRTDEALTAFAKLTTTHPDMAAAWYEQGRLLMQRHWLDSAVHCLQKATQLSPNNTWYLRALAQTYEMRQECRPWTETLERIVQQEPNNLDHYYTLSNAYLACGKVEDAIEVLNRVERKVGITEPVSLQKQRLWDAIGKKDKATREVEALADAMPQETRYQSILAANCMQQKQYQRAKKYYDRILQANPDDEYIHVQLAEYYKATGKPDEGDKEMLLAFANPRLASSTKIQLLTTFYSEEEFYTTRRDVCTQLLETAMSQSDDPSEYALFYGDLLMRQQRYDEAADQLAIALQRDSSQYAVWEGLLICLASVEGRDEQMYDYACRAAKLFPMHTLPLYLQGIYHLRNNHYEQALEPLERARKWGFSKGYLEAETLGMLADAYYHTEQYDKAWPLFDRAIELRPTDYGTLNNYAYYLGQQGLQLEKALNMSRRTIEAEPDNANSLDTYAWLLHLLGRDAEALPYMQRAVRLDPNSATLQHHLRVIEGKE